MNDSERARACNTLNAAIRNYARDPSRVNATTVEVAWKAFQKRDAISLWRQWKERRLGPATNQMKVTGGSK